MGWNGNGTFALTVGTRIGDPVLIVVEVSVSSQSASGEEGVRQETSRTVEFVTIMMVTSIRNKTHTHSKSFVNCGCNGCKRKLKQSNVTCWRRCGCRRRPNSPRWTSAWTLAPINSRLGWFDSEYVRRGRAVFLSANCNKQIGNSFSNYRIVIISTSLSRFVF